MQEIGYILHRGDEKDPGSDQALNVNEWGYEVWQLQAEVPDTPNEPQFVYPLLGEPGANPGNISLQSAYWVDGETIAWDVAADAGNKASQSPVVESEREAKEAPMQAQAAVTPDAARVQAVQAPQQRPSSHVTDFISAVDQLNPLGYLFAAFGTILLVGMLVVGIVAVLRIPWLVSSGFPDPSVNEEMTQVLGASWPLLIDRLIHFFCIFLAVASATFFAIGRRRAGAKHIIRAVIGILLMLGALSFLSDMIPQHYYADGQIVSMWQSGQTGPAIEALITHANDDLLIPATCLFLASIVILAWPPRRAKLIATVPAPATPTD